MFVHDKPLQSRLLLMGKVRMAFEVRSNFPLGWLWPCLQTLDLAGNAFHEQTLAYLAQFYVKRIFYNKAPGPVANAKFSSLKLLIYELVYLP